MMKSRDPLLMGAKFTVGLGMAVLIFAAVMVAIGLGAVATVERGATYAKLAEAGVAAGAYPLLLAALGLLVIVLAIATAFLRELYRIIASVDDGDPFHPANARRLARMGWMSLSIQAGLLVTAMIAASFREVRAALLAEDAINISLGAIVLTLVLFILARVFRVGAAMRDDLEGTV